MWSLHLLLVWPVLVRIWVAINSWWLLEALVVGQDVIRHLFTSVWTWLQTSPNPTQPILPWADSPVYKIPIQMQGTWAVRICWVSRRHHARSTFRFLEYSGLSGRKMEVLLVRAKILLLLGTWVNEIAEWTAGRSLSQSTGISLCWSILIDVVACTTWNKWRRWLFNIDIAVSVGRELSSDTGPDLWMSSRIERRLQAWWRMLARCL